MSVCQRFKKPILSTLISCLGLAAAVMGGCSSEVGSSPSSVKPAVVEEHQSERSKGSSKAVEKMKSIKSRVLGPGGEK